MPAGAETTADERIAVSVTDALRLVTSMPHVLPALSGSEIRDMTEETVMAGQR